MQICYFIRQISVLSCERFMLCLKHFLIKTQPLRNSIFEKFKFWDVYCLKNYLNMSALKNTKLKKRNTAVADETDQAEVEIIKRSKPIKKSVVVKCLQDMRSAFECKEEKPKILVLNKKHEKNSSVVNCLDDMKSNIVSAESDDTDVRTVNIHRQKKTSATNLAAESLRYQRNETTVKQETNVSTLKSKKSNKNLENPEEISPNKITLLKSRTEIHGNTKIIKCEKDSDASSVDIKQETVKIKEEPCSPIKEIISPSPKKSGRSHIKLKYEELKKEDIKLVRTLFYCFIIICADESNG